MRIQDYLLLTFKVIHGFNQLGYLRDMIRLRSSVKDLRGSYRLEIPRVNTTAYGLHSLRFSAAKRWNDLDESVRILENFNNFKNDFCILDSSTVTTLTLRVINLELVLISSPVLRVEAVQFFQRCRPFR